MYIAFNIPFAPVIILLVFCKKLLEEMSKLNYFFLLTFSFIIGGVLLYVGLTVLTPVVILDYLYIISVSNIIVMFFNIACVAMYDPVISLYNYVKKTFNECLEECKNKN